jgi:hypothetical protein
MASKTNVTWKRREQRRKNAGKARKAANRNHGTTPPFAIHTPEVDAAAPAAQVAGKAG